MKRLLTGVIAAALMAASQAQATGPALSAADRAAAEESGPGNAMMSAYSGGWLIVVLALGIVIAVAVDQSNRDDIPGSP